MDGVILDSMNIWEDLGARLLLSQGIQPEAGLNKVLFSMSMEEGAAYLRDHYPLGLKIQEILNELQQTLENFYFDEVLPKAGARELLLSLKERNIPVIAATSSPRTHITKALERSGLLSFFREILTTTEVGESKHSPKIFQLAAEKLGTVPEETLVFEDSLYALLTARKAGFRTVGIYDAHGEQDQEGLKNTADMYLMTLAGSHKLLFD